MAVLKVGNVIPKHSKLVKNIANHQKTEPRTVINSFEFHAGFIPPRPKNNPVKVQHFIDSLI